jgi:hypothetical protein
MKDLDPEDGDGTLESLPRATILGNFVQNI